MASLDEPERLEILLALALAFSRSEMNSAPAEDEHESIAVADGSREVEGVLEFLGGLDAEERSAIRRRLEWYLKLAPEKQSRWLARTIGRARAQAGPGHLDESIHPSHIIEALLEEPPCVQAVVLNHLPPSHAEICAASLNETKNRTGKPQSESAASRDDAAQQESIYFASTSSKREAEPEIVDIVRQAFLSNFVDLHQIHHPSALDLLSGTELARLARLLGVRETAVACRGIAHVESVTAFLRRFAAEDAHAIAAHIATLTKIESNRIAFAEQIVREAMNLETEPGAMLDRVGLHVLAIAVSLRGSTRLLYTAQKLPLAAAHWLRSMAESENSESEIVTMMAKETESLAASLRRTHTRAKLRATGAQAAQG